MLNVKVVFFFKKSSFGTRLQVLFFLVDIPATNFFTLHFRSGGVFLFIRVFYVDQISEVLKSNSLVRDNIKVVKQQFHVLAFRITFLIKLGHLKYRQLLVKIVLSIYSFLALFNY